MHPLPTHLLRLAHVVVAEMAHVVVAEMVAVTTLLTPMAAIKYAYAVVERGIRVVSAASQRARARIAGPIISPTSVGAAPTTKLTAPLSPTHFVR